MEQMQLLQNIFPIVIEQPVLWGQEKNIYKAEHYKALVDSQTGNVFSVVTTDYKVIRHEDAIEFLDKELAKSSDLGRYEAKTHLPNNGARMVREYTFPERTVNIVKGDEVHPKLILYNSYDQSFSLTILLGAVRLVCQNGLVTGQIFFRMKRRHTCLIKEINIRKDLSVAMKNFNVQTQTWQRWTQNLLPKKSFVKVMDVMSLGKQKTSIIGERLDSQSTGNGKDGFPIITIWNFFNILTWYITHELVSINQRVIMENRLRRAIVNFKNR